VRADQQLLLTPKNTIHAMFFFLLFTYYDYIKVVFIDVLLIHHKIVHMYEYIISAINIHYENCVGLVMNLLLFYICFTFFITSLLEKNYTFFKRKYINI